MTETQGNTLSWQLYARLYDKSCINNVIITIHSLNYYQHR